MNVYLTLILQLSLKMFVNANENYNTCLACIECCSLWWSV